MGRIIDRRRVMGGKSLPYDAEIEYLEGDGKSWIDTDIVADFNTTIKEKAAARGRHIGSMTLGCRRGNSNSARFFAFTNGGDSGPVRFVMGNRQFTTAYTFNESPHTILFNTPQEHAVYFDDNKLGVFSENDYSFTADYHLEMFRASGYGNVGGGYARIWYAKIYQDDALVRDFIPVRVGNVGYMYDKVSGQLFGNAGTGAFILGPDK